MKKRVLALLLGGVMAVGGLFLQTPVTAQAKEWPESCKYNEDAHIRKSEIAVVDKKVQITYDLDCESEDGYLMLYFYTVKQKKVTDIVMSDGVELRYGPYYDVNRSSNRIDKIGDYPGPGVLGMSGTYVYPGQAIEGEEDPFTYYIYAKVIDTHDFEGNIVHRGGTYLGWAKPATGEFENADIPEADGASSGNASSGSTASGNTSSSSKKSEWASYEEKVNGQIKTAEAGSTIEMEKGISTLSNSIMKELAAKGDVSLKLEFTYEDKEYVIIIPAGAALDNDIPWYGPLYLAQHFGNGAESALTAETSKTYVVKAGDNMNKIAKANNMTLTQLLTKNPEIKNPNKIVVGQKINL